MVWEMAVTRPGNALSGFPGSLPLRQDDNEAMYGLEKREMVIPYPALTRLRDPVTA